MFDPFITTQLNRCEDSSDELKDSNWSKVREAQRQAGIDDPNITVVPILGLPLSDGVHISVAANLELGQRFAASTLGLVFDPLKTGRPRPMASGRLKSLASRQQVDHSGCVALAHQNL